ncbi:MAG: hypothetical protein JSW50_14390 [Candidatus Latescibacterota bacterium]|nr:MAG: hypothetical protein JSW50_14390 [Candidatus Latescibacterota bacterium]
MEFIDSPTEQTTAATDVVLVVLGVAAALYLRRFHGRAPWKVNVWSGMFLFLAVAAGVGAVNHGLVLDEATRRLLWQPLNLSLATAVILAVAGSVYDWRGLRVARKVLFLTVVIPPLFWLATLIGDFEFGAFVIFSAPAMLFTLAVYVGLALGSRRLAGASWMAAGLMLTIAANGIQASGAVYVTVVWPFDHNGVFHIVQAVGIVVLVMGLRLGLIAVEKNDVS